MVTRKLYNQKGDFGAMREWMTGFGWSDFSLCKIQMVDIVLIMPCVTDPAWLGLREELRANQNWMLRNYAITLRPASRLL